MGHLSGTHIRWPTGVLGAHRAGSRQADSDFTIVCMRGDCRASMLSVVRASSASALQTTIVLVVLVIHNFLQISILEFRALFHRVENDATIHLLLP